MAIKNILKAVELQAFDSSSLDGTLQALNPGGLSAPCSILRVINDSNKSVIISYDGSTEQDIVRSQSDLQLPAQTNAQPNSYAALFPQGMVVYGEGEAGTGTIYVAAYYQPSAG